MINQQRVKLMTRLAVYEKEEGKKNASIGSYFRGDYISLQIIKSVICATIAFILIVGMYAFYDFEVFMADIYKMDMMFFLRKLVMYYAVTVIGYTGLSYAVYAVRYAKAKKRLRVYFNNLKRLSILYQREGKDKEK